SHAHTLKPLIEDLGLITLVITDIDTIDPKSNGTSVFPELGKGYQTNNTTLKKWLPAIEGYDALINLDPAKKINEKLRVAYQDTIVFQKENALPYTFEDALALTNLEVFKDIAGIGLIKKIKEAA